MKGIKYLAAGIALALVFSIKALGAGAPVEVEGVVSKDTVWSGEVLVVGDVYVPEGVTLTIAPGARVMFLASESSKIEPMFLSMQTELLVRGVLLARGAKDRPIRFGPAPEGINDHKPRRGDWGGIIFDGPASSGSAISDSELIMADSAVAAYGSSPAVSGCRIEDSRYGLVCMGASAPMLSGCVVTGCEFGIVASRGGKPILDGCKVEKNEHDYLQRD